MNRILMANHSPLHSQLTAAFRQRAWPHVKTLADQLLLQEPDNALGHFMGGIAMLEQRQMSSALNHLDRAATLAPERADFVAQLARALSMAQMPHKALAAASRVLELSPGDPGIFDLVGSVCAAANSPATAVTAFRRAVSLAPTHAAYRYNLATALISVGDINGTGMEIESCLDLDPRYWRAHLTLSHLRKQSATDNHVDRLTSLLLSAQDDATAQICLHLSLAKELDDLGDYPRAFDHLSRGKAASRAGIEYSTDRDRKLFSAMERAFPEPPADIHAGNPTVEPIFVFGMPRTGTTLVDRILSSHPDVYSAGELQNFGMTLRRHWGSSTPVWADPDIARRVQLVNWHRVGAEYVLSTRPATGHTRHFIDKFPFNYMYAGFIAAAFPNARMICLRRHPLDTCFGNFRRLFAEKLPYYDYSFDLLDTGRYYVLFDRLMAHWQRVLPGRILELPYETLVESQETSTRRLLEFCGLPWHNACLHFENNPGFVGTGSSLQVRSPIYRSALGHWKNYEPQLAGLRELLTKAGIDIPA